MTNTHGQMIDLEHRVRKYHNILMNMSQGNKRFQIFCSHLEKYPELAQRIKQTSKGTNLIPTGTIAMVFTSC